jgi:hypothetical protein
MARGRGIFIAALFAALGGIGLLTAISMKGSGPQGPLGISAAGSRSEPEVILQGVEMREIRKEGAPYKVFSEQATYSILSSRFSGSGVTLELSGNTGEMVVRAPIASWDMRTGRVFLPEGGTAENRTGWSAAVASANLSLPERMLTSAGKARLSGPGLSVVGDNLVWNWREGTVALELPKTRLSPSRAFQRRG